MEYAIAVTTRDGRQIRWRIVHLFTDTTWSDLWTEFSIGPNRWIEWRATDPQFAIVPELPTVSRLAYIDEGTVSLDPLTLKQESERVLAIAGNADVRAVMEGLRRAAIAAVEIGGVVDVFPAASGERVGSQFSRAIGSDDITDVHL